MAHESKSPESPKNGASEYETLKLGILRIILGEKKTRARISLPGKQQYDHARELFGMLSWAQRFIMDVYALGRVPFTLLWTFQFLESLAPGMRLYTSNWIMSVIEKGAMTGQPDMEQIKRAMITRLLLTAIFSLLWSAKMHIKSRFEHRIKTHFEFLQIKATLSKGFAELEESDDQDSEYSQSISAYGIMEQLTGFASTAGEIGSESIALLQIILSQNMSRFIVLMVFLRVSTQFDLGDTETSFWSKGGIYRIESVEYVRMRALKVLATCKEYRQEVLTNNLASYIINEYSKAWKALSDVPIASDIYDLLENLNNPIQTLWVSYVSDWPTLLYGFSALFGRTAFSFATITSLQTASESLGWKFSVIFGSNRNSLSGILVNLKDFYSSLEVTPDITANANSYPANHSSPSGMAINMRNVTFNYPTSKSTRPALQDVSLSIEPGQLVVIVGANGSGKTSLTKLLTRLYEPSSGQVLVDGRASSSYKLSDLRDATALLSQDHNLFPFSIAENIAVGLSQNVDDEVQVRAAAERGGASAFVRKLEDGIDTVLEPTSTKGSWGLSTHHPLLQVLKTWERSTDVSGGERQRLVAARTFMRMCGDRIKLVVVDEPSAAMDPAGEYELFEQLREARSGKTMIFITHRFGHLVKHADLILCMKDGQIIEQGTHEELHACQGEYFTLYNVQAQAFT